MNVLVTGGAGFIGSHLVRALLAKSCNVKVVDDLSASNFSALPRVSDKLTVYRGSVEDQDLLSSLMTDVTHVVHLATRNITVSETDPARAFSVNTGGTANVLRSASRAKRVVFTSTTSVYRDDDLPASESHEPEPRTLYSVSKLAAEACGDLFLDVPLTILRLSNVYGPGQSDSDNPHCGVVGHFMRAAREDRPMLVYGDGEATRDYTYVDDAVAAIVTALEGNRDGVFNVSTGVGTSTLDLSRLVAASAGKTHSVEHRSARSIDVVKHRVVNSQKFRNGFSWAPLVPIEDGLRRTWESWR